MDKYEVISKCEAIISGQISRTTNQNIRIYLDELRYRLRTVDMANRYKIIPWSDTVYLIDEDYQNEVNFCLYPNRKLHIGKFDMNLNINDRRYVLIDPENNTCFMGWNDHGTPRGDCEVARIEYDRKTGRPITYEFKDEGGGKRGQVVNNKKGNLLSRLVSDETISRKDYLICILLVCFLPKVYSALVPFKSDVLLGISSIVLLVVFYMMTCKRMKDAGHKGVVVYLGSIFMFSMPLLLLYPLFASTKVRTEEEAMLDHQQDMEDRNRAQRSLSRRCDSSASAPTWFHLTTDEMAQARRLRNGGMGQTASDKDADREHENNMETAKNSGRRDELDASITAINSDIETLKRKYNSAKSDYDDEKREESKYDDLARNTSDYSLKSEYESKASYHRRKADQYKADMSNYDGQIRSLTRDKEDMIRELDQLG